jgi:hypothetical protein
VNVIAGPPLELEAGKPVKIPDVPEADPAPAFNWAGALSACLQGLAWIAYDSITASSTPGDVSGDTPELGNPRWRITMAVSATGRCGPKAPVLVYPKFSISWRGFRLSGWNPARRGAGNGAGGATALSRFMVWQG